MPSPPVTPDSFRQACSKFATGIVVATVCDPEGAPHGLTVNSFTSVSLQPPLVLICLDHGCSILPLFRSCSHYGLSVLTEEQQALSARFAKKGQDRFEGVPWTKGESGVPLLPNALAHLECSVNQIVEAGDHAILIGEVVCASAQSGAPLLYFGSGYRALR